MVKRINGKVKGKGSRFIMKWDNEPRLGELGGKRNKALIWQKQQLKFCISNANGGEFTVY